MTPEQFDSIIIVFDSDGKKFKPTYSIAAALARKVLEGK
jgi:hypothetical protein